MDGLSVLQLRQDDQAAALEAAQARVQQLRVAQAQPLAQVCCRSSVVDYLIMSGLSNELRCGVAQVAAEEGAAQQQAPLYRLVGRWEHLLHSPRAPSSATMS